MQHISNAVNLIIRKIFAKQHPYLPEIIINWNKIVGLQFSQKANPYKIVTIKHKGAKHNILYVQVENSSTSLEISFQQEIIITRISVYLGFKAIDEIRTLVQ